MPYHFAADQKWKSEFDIAISGDDNTCIADVEQIDRIIYYFTNVEYCKRITYQLTALMSLRETLNFFVLIK